MASLDPQTVAITVVFLILEAIVLVLRCDIRYQVCKSYGWDDVLVICSWVCNPQHSVQHLAWSNHGSALCRL
jgi:hypothetical protein